jgi:hypothetical protein
MLHRLALAVAFATWTAALTAQAPVTTADFSGTWNIEFMSHQIALVIEPKDATKVTATMMMMGRDVPLKGELVGRTLTLVGDKAAGATADAPPAADPHGAAAATPKPITVTLQEDGTITGEMMTNRGPGSWTGERLKKRKQGR